MQDGGALWLYQCSLALDGGRIERSHARRVSPRHPPGPLGPCAPSTCALLNDAARAPARGATVRGRHLRGSVHARRAPRPVVRQSRGGAACPPSARRGVSATPRAHVCPAPLCPRTPQAAGGAIYADGCETSIAGGALERNAALGTGKGWDAAARGGALCAVGDGALALRAVALAANAALGRRTCAAPNVTHERVESGRAACGAQVGSARGAACGAAVDACAVVNQSGYPGGAGCSWAAACGWCVRRV